jgi:hypothetical protein
MKKLLGILAVIMLIAGFAGQTHAAYFGEYELLRFVFQTGTDVSNEWGTDLGIQAKAPGSAWSYGNKGDLLAVSNFSDMSKVKVTYWAKENINVLPGQYWITGGYKDGDGLTLTSNKGSNLNTVTDTVTGKYAGYNQSTVMLAKSNAKSEYYNIEKNSDSSIGAFANTLKTPVPGKEAVISLADLVTGNHEVMSSLYYFNYNNAELDGTLVAYIRTYMTAGVDGLYNTLGDNFIGTEIKPVPVPAALWLLGSGLGFFGIGRKITGKYFA